MMFNRLGVFNTFFFTYDIFNLQGVYWDEMKISWRRAWLPTPIFLSGEPLGQRSLVGDSPWGIKESDTTKVT